MKKLIISGARQVGKTFILKKFGETEFNEFHYFNFESDKKLSGIFDVDLNPLRIISELSVIRKINPLDLIIFDEIQACPSALTTLKYFSEALPNQAIVCAGSLLGIELSDKPFPVGKVNHLNLYPLSFKEFLGGIGDGAALEQLSRIHSELIVSDFIHEHLSKRFRSYCVTGGLPKPILSFDSYDELGSFENVRQVQRDLVKDYHSDFSKHSGKANAVHIRGIFENIPAQLSREVDGSTSKFKFSGVLPNKKSFSDLMNPIEWLVTANLIQKVKIANLIQPPVASFTKENIFKLYLFDTGLLGSFLDLAPPLLYLQDYGITKGFFAENIILQELTACGISPIYSWANNHAEVEFIANINGKIIPIEVKSSRNLRAKSLLSYIKRYSPEIAIRFYSGKPQFDKKLRILNLPLYLAGEVAKIDLNRSWEQE